MTSSSSSAPDSAPVPDPATGTQGFDWAQARNGEAEAPSGPPGERTRRALRYRTRSSALEAAAITLALAGIGAGWVAWRLATGTLPIGPAAGQVEGALARLIGEPVEIGRLDLAFDQERRDFVVVASGVSALSTSRVEPLDLGEMDVTLDLASLVAGRARIKRASFRGLSASLVRDAEGRSAFGFGPPEDVAKLQRRPGSPDAARRVLEGLRAALAEEGPGGRLQALELAEGRLVIMDVETGAKVTLQRAGAVFERRADGRLGLRAFGELDGGGGFSVDLDAPGTLDSISAAGALDRLRPASIALRGVPAMVRQADLPLSGTWDAQLDATGRVTLISGRLQSGPGVVAGRSVRAASASLRWDPMARRFDLSDARIDAEGLSAANLSGALSLRADGGVDARVQADRIAARGLGIAASASGDGVSAQWSSPAGRSLTGAPALVSGSGLAAIAGSGRLVLERGEGSAARPLAGFDGLAAAGLDLAWGQSGAASTAGALPVSARFTRLSVSGPAGRTVAERGDGAAGLDARARPVSARLRVAGLTVDLEGGSGGSLRDAAVEADRQASGWRVTAAGAQADGRSGGRSASVAGFRFSAAPAASDSWRTTLDAADMRAEGLPLAMGLAAQGLSFAGQVQPGRLSGVRLAAERASLAAPRNLAAPVEVTALRFEGDVTPRRIDIADAALRYGRAGARGRGFVEPAPRGSARLRLDAELTGSVTLREVLAAWPRGWLDDTRGEITRMVRAGSGRARSIALNVPPGLLKGDRAPDDAITLDFDVEDASVVYLAGMTPLTGLRGRARLRGNSMQIDVDSGQAGPLRILGGTVDLPQYQPPGAIATFTARIAGDATDMAREIDLPPLRLLSSENIAPERITGTGEVDVIVTRPMRSNVREQDVGVTVSGRFEDAGFERAFGDLAASGGEVTLDGSRDRISVRGKAFVAGGLFDFAWSSGQQDSPGPATRLVADGTMPAEMLPAFGLDVSQYATGDVRLGIRAASEDTGISGAVVTADLVNASVRAPGDLWTKPIGTQARVSARVFPREGAGWSILDLRADAPGAQVRGALDLRSDLSFVSARFSKLAVDGVADVAADITADDGNGYTLALRGPFADLSPFLANRDVSVRTTDAFDRPLNVSIDLDRLRLSATDSLDAVSATLIRDATGWRALSAQARSAAGESRISLRLEPDGRRSIDGDVADAGLFARLAYPAAEVQGGRAVLRGELPARGVGAGALTLEASGVTVTPPGAGAMLFDTVRLPMTVDRQLLRLPEGLASGPGMTVKASGYVDLETGSLELAGVATPGGLNRAVGELPLVGPLLGGGRDEGLLGLTFQVRGDLARPQVRANPLSALAPGVLRRLFQAATPVAAPRKPAEADRPAAPQPPVYGPRED